MNEKVRSINTYINNVATVLPEQKFTADCITVEHRSGNPKRDFLFVNKVQGKHIPTLPSKTISMCNELAAIVNKGIKKYASDDICDFKVLVVGFAETATAIAECTAWGLECLRDVILTTREPRMDEKANKLLTFEEEHSHATTQNIYYDKNKSLSEVAADFKKYDYVLFIDDEISTGNTIINFMKAFKALNLNSKLRFGVASICNWQSEKDQETFKQYGIDRFFLLGGELINKDVKMEVPDENIVGVSSLRYNKPNNIHVHRVETDGDSFLSNRLVHSPDYTSNHEIDVVEEIYKNILNDGNTNKTVRVIGTEEFMYLPLKVALNLEKSGYNVKYHATTRSRIDIMSPMSMSDIEDYDFTGHNIFNELMREDVINSSFRVPSIYEKGRDTYIYNIQQGVDTVIIITDAVPSKETMLYYTNMFDELCICNDVHFIIVE